MGTDMKYSEFTALFADARKEIAYIADIETCEMHFMSHRAMELLGLSREEDYRGKKCYQIMQGRDQICPFCTNGMLQEGKTHIWEHFNPVAGRWMRMEDHLFTVEGRLCRGTLAVDISQERAAVSRLANQLDREKVLMKCVRTLALEPDISRAVHQLLNYICSYYLADQACIFEVDHSGSRLNNTYEWCAPGVDSRMAHRQNCPLPREGRWLECGAGEAAPCVWVDGDGNGGETAAGRGTGKLMVVALHEGEKEVGFLSVENVRRCGEDEDLLRLTADLIVEEFQKRQLLRDLGGLERLDRLTGLQDRSSYLKKLEEMERRPPEQLAVFALDLNGLKEMNEERGHNAGDRFITRCAEILGRLNMNAYRVDGDEFIVLQPDISREETVFLERRLRAELAQLWPNTVSLGLTWGAAPVNALALVTEADERMYADKQIYYRKILSQEREFRTGMASGLLEEIRARRFLVYFQPQVDLASGRIYGAEALVRKVDEEGRMVPPDRFVPFYEAEGIISHLDFHVLEKSCMLLEQWRRNLGKRPRISVNFSRQTLMEPDVVSRIQSICARYNVAPAQITVEVTESAGKVSHEFLHSLVRGLQRAGFFVSLDDFGSRYSNLTILTDIDFHIIKLDKSLIDPVAQETKGTHIVKNLLQMCRETLSTPVLAEGVESAGQVAVLKKFGCDYAQGYYFSRPVPAEDFAALLVEDRVFPL